MIIIVRGPNLDCLSVFLIKFVTIQLKIEESA